MQVAVSGLSGTTASLSNNETNLARLLMISEAAKFVSLFDREAAVLDKP